MKTLCFVCALVLTAATWSIRMAASDPGTGEWPMWGGTPDRNMVSNMKGLPTEWDVKTKKNVKWVAKLGSQSYGNPVVGDGKVFMGTNNGASHLKRFPPDHDLGCLLCFDTKDGHLVWQHSSEKMPTGRVHDWPLQGVCSAPLVEGNRLWFVTNRGEVRCLDTEGFRDGEDDGPVKGEWAKQFDLVKLDDPAKDKVAPALAALGAGSLTADVRKEFMNVGI